MQISKQSTVIMQADAIANEIILLFEQYGDEDYDGEPVSQASHMIQCAMLAMQEDAGEELILSAFLHDIGHLLKHRQETGAIGKYGVVNHEGIGADYLRGMGFSERVCSVIENHVQAKRFLVATEASYENNLSEASRQTLQWQGGPMSHKEVVTFREHPFFKDIIQVRIWDEEAKNADAVLVPIVYFKSLIYQHLTLKNNYGKEN